MEQILFDLLKSGAGAAAGVVFCYLWLNREIVTLQAAVKKLEECLDNKVDSPDCREMHGQLVGDLRALHKGIFIGDDSIQSKLKEVAVLLNTIVKQNGSKPKKP